MSKVKGTWKNQATPQQKSIHENDTGSKTYIDSLYSSNLKEKENFNFKNYQNIITEIYTPKINQAKTNININKKEKNFCLALRALNDENSHYVSGNISKTSKNLLSKISEFSEMNPDMSKDYNVSKYLHHPIMKQITKLGNQIIKKQNCNEYKVNNGLEINKPLVSIYNMKNIFENFNLSYIGMENSSINRKMDQNETINNKNIIHQRKKLKYFHRKNKSSITNYYFNENNNLSSRTIINYNNNIKKYAFHIKDNISSLIGQNKIIFKDRDSATTVTKEDYNKDIYIHDLNDLNINILNNNKNLEVINDLDEAKENRIYSTNKKNEDCNKTKSNNKRIIDIYGNKDNTKTFNKNYNLSVNKTLRKKYERTEFIMRNLNHKNNQSNSDLMKNLMIKFEQCCKNEKNQTLENKLNDNIKENLNHKNNDTFIVNEGNDSIKFILEVSENDKSFIKNNNIQLSEISSNKLNRKISYNGIKTKYRLNKFNSIEENSLTSKTINSCPLINNQKNKKNLQKNIYKSPYDLNKNNHHFDLFSPFKEKNDNNENNKKDEFNSLNQINNIKNENNEEEEQVQTIFDYSFYVKLLKAEDMMIKRYKIISKNDLILNTELRLKSLIWMMKTCEEFAFKRDTFHNSCYFFDMYLTIIALKSQKNKKMFLKNKSEFELIALTCIVISAKLEEIQLPHLKEYAELLSNNYDENSIIEMEKKICSELRWKLIVITKNTWLSWYICQWDLFIETVNDIKSELLKLIPEDDILYFKKPTDNSYYNFRKICQLIDIMALDYYSYNYEPRLLISASFFIILCNKYSLKYNFNKKKFDNNSKLSEMLLDIYTEFILQSFDYNFNNDNLQKVIKYFYTNYLDLQFVFDLPLLYQIHPNKIDTDSYEDFLTYQTTNDNFYKAVKDKIYLNKNIRKVTKKLKDKNKKKSSFIKNIFNK